MNLYIIAALALTASHIAVYFIAVYRERASVAKLANERIIEVQKQRAQDEKEISNMSDSDIDNELRN